MIYDWTSLTCLPIFLIFVKVAKHIHHTELGTMVCVDFFKMLPCICFIRLEGRQRCAESEKRAMEQRSLRNIGLKRLFTMVTCRQRWRNFITQRSQTDELFYVRTPLHMTFMLSTARLTHSRASKAICK